MVFVECPYRKSPLCFLHLLLVLYICFHCPCIADRHSHMRVQHEPSMPLAASVLRQDGWKGDWGAVITHARMFDGPISAKLLALTALSKSSGHTAKDGGLGGALAAHCGQLSSMTVSLGMRSLLRFSKGSQTTCCTSTRLFIAVMCWQTAFSQ